MVLSPALISFRLHGLDFAQARIAHDPSYFESGEEIVFGIGAEERVLDARNEADFTDLMRLAAAIRGADGPKNHALWRMHPERWLESCMLADIEALDGRLRSQRVYSQVPAFSAADRAMIDVLAMTRENRLAVIELKANEDIHLPTGRASPGAKTAENFGPWAISLARRFRRRPRCYSWWLPRCMCIRRRTRSCAIFRPALNGSCWGLTTAGARESAPCSGNERAICELTLRSVRERDATLRLPSRAARGIGSFVAETPSPRSSQIPILFRSITSCPM